jgi:hypothetical protein
MIRFWRTSRASIEKLDEEECDEEVTVPVAEVDKEAAGWAGGRGDKNGNIPKPDLSFTVEEDRGSELPNLHKNKDRKQ